MSHIKNTSYIPKPKKWLQFRRFKTIFLKLIHINVRIRWCIFCANSCSRNFMEYLLSKLRVLISENKFGHSRKSVGIFLFCLQLSPSLRASRPTLCGMLRPKPTKSAVTKIESWGIFPILWTFLKKSWGSLIHDQPSCIMGLRWWSKNPENFCVGVQRFKMTPKVKSVQIFMTRSRGSESFLMVDLCFHRFVAAFWLCSDIYFRLSPQAVC